MHRLGEDKRYTNPLIPFVLAIIFWMWAAIVYLSGEHDIKPFRRMSTELLKWAFGNVGGAIVLVLLGGLFLWAGIWMKNKKKQDDRDNFEES